MSTQKYEFTSVSHVKMDEPKKRTCCLSTRVRFIMMTILIVVFICVVVVLSITLVNKQKVSK